jgi:hypothetical protein
MGVRPGRIAVAVRDPSVARDVPLPRAGLLIGGKRLPRITEPSETDLSAAMMRRNMPTERGPAMYVNRHSILDLGQLDTPRYLGLGGRAAIVLRLARTTRADMSSLGAALSVGEPRLFLRAHQVDRYGLLEARIVLPDEGLAFDTLMSLASGDAQEFLAAAYDNETIELHLSHQTDDRLLALAYRAHGVRPVLDRVLDTLTDLAPPNADERDEVVARCRARLDRPGDEPPTETAVRLESAGQAELAVSVQVVL